MSNYMESMAFGKKLHEGYFDSLLQTTVRLIPFEGRLLGETRRIDFLKAFGQRAEVSRIVAFARCNMRCPHCARGAQYIDADYNVKDAVPIRLGSLLTLVDSAVKLGETIRLSGGDPSMYPEVSSFIAKYVVFRGGKVSYCHNGTAPAYVRRLLPYTSSAGVDIKSLDKEELILRTGVEPQIATRYMKNSLDCVRELVAAGIRTEVRTTVFEDTKRTDLENIAQELSRIGGGKALFWTLRNYDPMADIDSVNWSPMPVKTLLDIGDQVSRRYSSLIVGYRRNWNDGNLRYISNGVHHV